MVPGVSVYSMNDGRKLPVGRIANLAVRIRQLMPGASVDILDQGQPALMERLRGDGAFGWDFRTIFPRQTGMTWVITHVAMQCKPGQERFLSLELMHRKVGRTFSAPWIVAGEELATPIDVTVDDRLAVRSGQADEAVIVLRGVMIWSPEFVEAEKKS